MEGFYDTLIAEYGKCPSDCLACEEACAREKGDGKGGRIKRLPLPELSFYGVVKCNQCSQPACGEVCPTQAITRSNGVVQIAEERCISCGLCTLACPYGAIYYSPGLKKAFKCDNCQGKPEPECVKACKYGILSLARSRPVYEHLGEDLIAPGVLFCQGCGIELSLRLAVRVLGKETIFFSGPGCTVLSIAALFPGTSLRAPSFPTWMTNMPAIMTGVKRYFRNIGEDITCVGFAGDGMTADVGFQSLSGAAERGENIIYICHDNQAYMNTGIQRSSTTPLFGWTTTTPVGQVIKGKQRAPKNVPLLMAFHGVRYVATATIAFPEDYVLKLSKAKAVKDGMAYIHVLIPCPTGWRSPANEAIELSKMAVETGYFPLWEAEDAKFNFTYRPKSLRPVKEFTRLMGRFSHLTSEELEELQKLVNSRYNLIDSLVRMQ